LSIATNLNTKIRSKQQSLRNTSDAHNILEAMDGVLSNMSSMVIRMKELAIGSASDTYGANERAIMQKEISQTVLELERMAQNSSYLDSKLLVGDDKKLEIKVNTNNGKQDRISINLKDMAQPPYALRLSDVRIETQHRAGLSLIKIDYAQEKSLQKRAKTGASIGRISPLFA
jgi:flagellin